MNYQDTVCWMFQQLPMYQNIGKVAFKKDLTNTIKLDDHLGNPHKNFKSVHVAGTNGKGSTSHALASVLQEAGYKVGLYTSPHLKDFRERIRINGIEITEDFVVQFIQNNMFFFEANSLSFFEMTVGMAFDYFSKEKVDIAVIEVGMGGRLDSTNIIIPEVSVITNIGLDHVQFLGDTYELIAAEKAGIIKPIVPVVIGETQAETTPVFNKISEAQNAPMYFADQLIMQTYDSDLKGNYQKHNIKTVVQTIKLLNEIDFTISETQLKLGLLKVVKNTGLKGRWQILSEHPKIICDTAHNKEGLTHVVEQLKSERYENLHIVFGVVNDKNLSSIFPILPKWATYYFCKPDVPRGLDELVLQTSFQSAGFVGQTYSSVDEALSEAKIRASVNDLVYVGGSTFVVAEVV